MKRIFVTIIAAALFVSASQHATAQSLPTVEDMQKQRRLLGMKADLDYIHELLVTHPASAEGYGFPMTDAEVVEFKRRGAFVQLVTDLVVPDAQKINGWAGAYVDQHEGGRFVLMFREGSDVDEDGLRMRLGKDAEGLHFRYVEFTETALDNAHLKLLEWWPRSTVDLLSVGISHQDNGLIIFVSEADVDLAWKLGAEILPSHMFRVEAAEPEVETVCSSRDTCYSPMKAGIRIRKGSSRSSSGCTMGFHIQRGSDEQFVTAGHCGWSGSNNWYHWSYGFVGSELASQYHNWGRDAMRVQISDVQDSNRVYNLHGTVTSSRNPWQGESVCASLGWSNAHRCGTVELSSTSWRGSKCGCTLFGADHSIANTGGDSGSPIFSSHPVAVGIQNTGSGKFARLGDVLSSWGASLRK